MALVTTIDRRVIFGELFRLVNRLYRLVSLLCLSNGKHGETKNPALYTIFHG